MFGPMGGDQRNMRGSLASVRDAEKYDGKGIEFPIEGNSQDDESYLQDMGNSYGVDVRFLYFDTFRLNGKKGDIKSFLKNLGYKPREYKEYL